MDDNCSVAGPVGEWPYTQKKSSPATADSSTNAALNDPAKNTANREAVALEESLRHIATKKQQTERLQRQADEGGSGNAALG